MILRATGISVLLLLIVFHLVFVVPDYADLKLIEAGKVQESKQCYQHSDRAALDANGEIKLLVWNIYKQNELNWQSVLSKFSHERQLILLQEVSLTEQFIGWLSEKEWGSYYVNAFEVFDTSAGVLSLSSQLPTMACAYIQIEPWLRLPKSALYTQYQLSNGQELAVVNIHGVNFTVGVEDYKKQLSSLRDALEGHKGPIIMAGDFNSWSDQRTEALMDVIGSLSLVEVEFSPDARTQFITGLSLDHVFVRGLEVIKAKAPMTDASDHNPLLVELRISGYKEPK